MTEQKQKAKLVRIIRTHQELVKLMKEFKSDTDGEVDFGYMSCLDEISVMHGMQKIGELLSVRPAKTDSGIAECPTEMSIRFMDTKLTQLY